LEVRARRTGDRVFGSTKRFKQVLIRSRVPRPYRDFVPVLALNGEIVSCPGFLPSRKPELRVNWFFDENAPFLDIDFI
jgi:tRNA(Ile)-lysidine synthetase-like protein